MITLKGRAKKIKWFVMDVDGVLTDGKVIYDSDGKETKNFSIKDGLGIRFLSRAGIKTAIITGRTSPMVLKRALELEITEVIQDAKQKLPVYEEFKKKHGLKDEEILYIGDDYVDLPILRRVGFPVCVPSAPEGVKEVCAYITQTEGGNGAVREVIEKLLFLQGKLDEILERYYQ